MDFIEINHKKENQLSSPLRISMNATKKCNLRCKQCFTESGKIQSPIFYNPYLC